MLSMRSSVHQYETGSTQRYHLLVPVTAELMNTTADHFFQVLQLLAVWLYSCVARATIVHESSSFAGLTLASDELSFR